MVKLNKLCDYATRIVLIVSDNRALPETINSVYNITIKNQALRKNIINLRYR